MLGNVCDCITFQMYGMIDITTLQLSGDLAVRVADNVVGVTHYQPHHRKLYLFSLMYHKCAFIILVEHSKYLCFSEGL